MVFSHWFRSKSNGNFEKLPFDFGRDIRMCIVQIFNTQSSILSLRFTCVVNQNIDAVWIKSYYFRPQGTDVRQFAEVAEHIVNAYVGAVENLNKRNIKTHRKYMVSMLFLMYKVKQRKRISLILIRACDFSFIFQSWKALRYEICGFDFHCFAFVIVYCNINHTDWCTQNVGKCFEHITVCYW